MDCPVFLKLLTRGVVGIASATFLNEMKRIRLKTSTVNKLFCVYIFAVTFNFDINSRVLVTHHGKRKHCGSINPMVVRKKAFLLKLTVLVFKLARLLTPSVIHLLVSSSSVFSTAVRFLG